MDVVIIGSGNVADVMGRTIQAAGHRLVELVARNRDRGEELAGQLGVSYQPDIRNTIHTADLYLVAISDDALPHLHEQLHLGKSIVAHTAGSVSGEVLKNVSTNYGVLYPLQTFTAGGEVPAFPLLVDGNNPETTRFLEEFAAGIAEQVVQAGDEERRKLHMMAVISGNFTHHLLALVQDYCGREGLDVQLLVPYMEQVIRSMKRGIVPEQQTGPAVRNDVQTLKKHLEMLSAQPMLADLYEKLTSSIQSYHRIQPKS